MWILITAYRAGARAAGGTFATAYAGDLLLTPSHAAGRSEQHVDTFTRAG